MSEQSDAHESEPPVQISTEGRIWTCRRSASSPEHGPWTLISLWRVPDNPQLWEHLGATRLDLEFEGCYCSILGECWRADLRTMKPARVADCKAGPDDYVEVGAGYDDVKVLPVLKSQ
jgi:hypothetical protein